MRHEIDCKVRAITSFFMFDLSVKANENLKKKVADKMAEEQSACSVSNFHLDLSNLKYFRKISFFCN